MKSLSKELVAIVIRSGIEIWVEKERADNLIQLLKSENCPQFIEYENQIINKADITGIFNPQTMDERTRRKNGQWQCNNGKWHEKFEKCLCNQKERIL